MTLSTHMYIHLLKYMKVFFTSCLSIIVFTLGTSYVSAATYHLSPTGNDTNNGSSTSPWKTINKANQTASSGDTIILKNGIYQGSGQAYQALTKAGVTWQAENKHQAIIDGGFSPESINFPRPDGRGFSLFQTKFVLNHFCLGFLCT